MSSRKEDYLFMIEQATKAPSGHNTQPWLFRLGKESIEIISDDRKVLHVVDGNRRELFVSLGCAVENLRLAAESKGYVASLEVAEGGIIHVELKPVDTLLKDGALYRQIGKRQSNRSVYNGERIPEEALRQLLTVFTEEGVRLHTWQQGSDGFEKIAHCVLMGNEIQMRDVFFKNELKQWMRFNKKHAQRTNDGLSYAVFGAPNLPQWVSRLVMGVCLTPRIQNQGDRKKLSSSSHLVLFTVKQDRMEEWIALGRTLERFLLKATGMGIAVAFTNQPCELKSLSEQMKRELPEIGKEEVPVVLLRIGYSKTMPYSLRKPLDEVVIDNKEGI